MGHFFLNCLLSSLLRLPTQGNELFFCFSHLKLVGIITNFNFRQLGSDHSLQSQGDAHMGS